MGEKLIDMKKNRLIAEFMQLPTEVFQLSGILNYGFDGAWYEEEELSYHLSWSWLMPVLDKIYSLGYHYEIQPRGMVIEGWHSSEVLVSKCFVYDKSQKEIIYDSVVEFINQYNKNK